MAIQLKKKQEMVAEIKGSLNSEGIVILAEFKGLTVAEVSEFRGKLRAGNVSYKVFKNSLIRHAAKEIDPDSAEMQKMFGHLKGPTALAYSKESPFEAAKMVGEFAKQQSQKVAVKCGFFEGKYLDQKSLEQLASIGSREQLIARLAYTLKSPLSRLVNALNSPSTKLACALNAVADKKEKG